MSPLSHDRSELKQRQQELSGQLADTLLSQDSPVKKVSNYQQDWQQHQALCERQQSLALLDSKLLEVLPSMEQREGQVAEAKTAVAQEVKALRQFAAELGKTAFAAVLSGDVAATPRFEARKTLHDHLEKLSHEKDALGRVDASKLTEKVKLKAQRLKMAGKIKMGQLKIGSLDRALGESLLNEKAEASVDCPQTSEVLEAITGQRAAIATATEKQADAQSQLADTLEEATQTLDRESVEGTTVLQAELKQVRKDARSIENSIATAREAVVAKALEDESLRDSEQLGPDLKQLWSTQFDLKASQSQVSRTADKAASRLSTLSLSVKYTICGAAGCLLLILLVVWFGKGDGTSLPEENQAAESTGPTALAALEETVSSPQTPNGSDEPSAKAGVPAVNSIGMRFVTIPSGTFMMGSPETEEDRKDNEHQHKVTITKAFYMQTTEVTQGQWQAVMDTEPWKGKSYVKEDANYPATYLDWNNAYAYCKKLSEIEDKTYRLPTEAEWEYACRAGTKTAWSFGDDENAIGDYAWYRGKTWDIGERYAHQVGLKKPNAFGLYDMHGNVYEWCHDCYGEDYYKQSPEQDPQGPATRDRLMSRVQRGGSWNYNTRYTRSANRGYDPPFYRHFHNGFRVVRELD